MSQFRHAAISQFADQQVRYAPRDRRLQQLDRAEKLLAEIDLERKYPYQYVCFRITEYRPDIYPDLVLDGKDLHHDLSQFIDVVSTSVPLPWEEAGENVLSVEDVSKLYRVSTKTVHRWRDRGLVARRFLHEGRRRVGFLQSSVDRFVSTHGDEVERGGRFSLLSEPERQKILYRARRLARVDGATLAEISRRIARKLGRSQETVRYTIKNHDKDFPTEAIFSHVRAPLDDESRQLIYKAFRRDISIDALAEKYDRTRSTIYRIINEIRARRILDSSLEFMEHVSFAAPGIETEILGPEPITPANAPNPRPPAGLPQYLQSLYEVPLLTREQEQYLFRRMNFQLYRAKKLRESVDIQRAKSSVLDDIERFEEDAKQIKTRLVRANLRLVVSIAKRHVSNGGQLFELISDGNLSLMRAVEKFDYSRGFKFSTYASWAIMKNFARSIPQENSQRDRFVTGHDLAFETTPDDRSVEAECEHEHQQVQSAIGNILNRLEARERQVITERYGIDNQDGPLTLEQVGTRLGVTKERVRQIEARAIQKMRQFAAEANLELTLFG